MSNNDVAMQNAPDDPDFAFGLSDEHRILPSRFFAVAAGLSSWSASEAQYIATRPDLQAHAEAMIEAVAANRSSRFRPNLSDVDTGVPEEMTAPHLKLAAEPLISDSQKEYRCVYKGLRLRLFPSINAPAEATVIRHEDGSLASALQLAFGSVSVEINLAGYAFVSQPFSQVCKEIQRHEALTITSDQ